MPWKSEYAVSNSSIKRNSYGQIQEHAETLPIPSISQFLNHRKLLAVFITLTFGWFTLFLVYTGLTLAAGKDGYHLVFYTYKGFFLTHMTFTIFP